MLVPREQLKVAIGGVVKDRTHYILRLLSILSLYPEALLEELFPFFYIFCVSLCEEMVVLPSPSRPVADQNVCTEKPF